jgi:C-terminal processing protease CtpA/Prc
MKIVILTSRVSASASEVIAGTLQDWGYKVIGETSSGKGVGQSVFPLIDGSSFSLTTFEFLVGNSLRRVHGIGIKPDIEIKWEKKSGQTNEDFIEEYLNSFSDPLKDPQLMKAIGELNKL